MADKKTFTCLAGHLFFPQHHFFIAAIFLKKKCKAKEEEYNFNESILFIRKIVPRFHKYPVLNNERVFAHF